MQPDTEQLMKKLHASLCPNKLEAEIRDKFLALEAEIDRLKTLSVTNIMLAVVPGEDGGGQEIYAESVDDVVSLLSDMGERLDDYEGKVSTKDTELLDFLETEHYDNVFPLGKTWYSRLAYGQPYKKHNTLRSAIITAVNNKGSK